MYKQIKELEKEAKEGKYWKERYESLRSEVTNTSKKLFELVDVKVGKEKVFVSKTVKTSGKLYTLVEDLYRRMKIGEIQELNREIIIVEANKIGINTTHSSAIVSMVGNGIELKDGIQTVVGEARKRKFYYKDINKTHEQEAKKELMNTLKFDKVSFMK